MSLDTEVVPAADGTPVQSDVLEATASPLAMSLQDFVAEFGDELLDSLAKRAAAAQRFRNSLSPDQRAELDALAQQAFGSPSLMNALNWLDANLQAARPGEDWTGGEDMDGGQGMGLGEGTGVLADRPTTALETMANARNPAMATALPC